jgi:hypothetical protein
VIVRYRIHDHQYEAEYLGPAHDQADPCYPLRVRSRCVSPWPTDWQHFDTEPEWFRQRGLTPPDTKGEA